MKNIRLEQIGGLSAGGSRGPAPRVDPLEHALSFVTAKWYRRHVLAKKKWAFATAWLLHSRALVRWADGPCTQPGIEMQDHAMPVHLIQDLPKLMDLSDAWQRLSVNPMTSPEWLLTWWRHYGHGHQLFVLAVHDRDQQLIGLAPWYLKQHRVFGSTLHALGEGEACSDHVGLICESERKRDVAMALSDWLMSSEGTEHARLLQLDNTDADDQTLSLFAAACASRGAWIERRPGPSCWQVILPTTWEEYLASLSRNHRKRCRRWDRTYFKSQRVHVRAAQNSDELEEGMQILSSLHSSRRNSVGCRGVFDRNQFYAFHREVMGHLHNLNRLRLAWLVMDDRPIAIEYQMLSNDSLYAYQSGMDASRADISPGSLSVMASIRWAIDSGMRKFDFMRGDEAYKISWGATPVHTSHLRIRPSEIADTFRHGVSLATFQTRSWLRRHRQNLRALNQP